MLTLEAFGWMSQHELKISRRQVQNSSCVFDNTPNNFQLPQCIDRRSDCCILCPIHTHRKSLKTTSLNCGHNFLLTQTPSCDSESFLPPSAIRGLNDTLLNVIEVHFFSVIDKLISLTRGRGCCCSHKFIKAAAAAGLTLRDYTAFAVT